MHLFQMKYDTTVLEERKKVMFFRKKKCLFLYKNHYFVL